MGRKSPAVNCPIQMTSISNMGREHLILYSEIKAAIALCKEAQREK